MVSNDDLAENMKNFNELINNEEAFSEAIEKAINSKYNDKESYTISDIDSIVKYIISDYSLDEYAGEFTTLINDELKSINHDKEKDGTVNLAKLQSISNSAMKGFAKKNGF